MFFILDIHRLLNMSMATHMKKPLPHSRRVSPRGTLTCATVCTHEAIHALPIWGRLDSGSSFPLYPFEPKYSN